MAMNILRRSINLAFYKQSNNINVVQAVTIHVSSLVQSEDNDTLSEKTPLGRISDSKKLNNKKEGQESDGDSDPFAPFPEATNPKTGEIGGPTGPEPTRYGDWERKGRVTDF